MSILATAVTAAAEVAEHGSENGIYWAFGIGGGMMLVFLLLLLVMGSYTNVGMKHEAGPDVVDPSKQIGSFGPSGH